MAKSPEEMAAAMIANLKDRTGKTLPRWLEVVKASKLRKHGEIVKHLKDALEKGYQVGFTAGSDDHKGRPGAAYPGSGAFGVYGGLTCVHARELSREGIWERRRSASNGTARCCRTSASRMTRWRSTNKGRSGSSRSRSSALVKRAGVFYPFDELLGSRP